MEPEGATSSITRVPIASATARTRRKLVDAVWLMGTRKVNRRYMAERALRAATFAYVAHAAPLRFAVNTSVATSDTQMPLDPNDQLVDRRVTGVLLARDAGPVWFVEFLCSDSRQGVPLLKALCLEATRSRPNVERISLCALPHVLSYYHRFGFQFSGTCQPEPADVRGRAMVHDQETARWLKTGGGDDFGEDDFEELQQRFLHFLIAKRYGRKHRPSLEDVERHGVVMSLCVCRSEPACAAVSSKK